MSRLTEHPVHATIAVDTKSTVTLYEFGTNSNNRLTPENFRARFWGRVIRPSADACWSWTGSTLPTGRGQVHLRWEGRKSIRKNAPVVAWELTHGAITDPTLRVCHRCDNPNCCNPSHLFLGTQKENIHDCIRKGRRNAYGRQKLTDADVLDIRRLWAEGQTQKRIAGRFGIRPWSVSGIINGHTWTHLLPQAVGQHQPSQSESRLRGADVLDQVFEPVAFRQLPVLGEVS